MKATEEEIDIEILTTLIGALAMEDTMAFQFSSITLMDHIHHIEGIIILIALTEMDGGDGMVLADGMHETTAGQIWQILEDLLQIEISV